MLKLGDGYGREGKLVGEKHQALGTVGVDVGDAPESFGVGLRRIETDEGNGLVRTQTR